jgi:hypothetical protein
MSSSKFPVDRWRTRCTLLSHIWIICWVCGYFCWITSMSSLLHRRKKSLSLSHRFPVVVGGCLYVGVIRAPLEVSTNVFVAINSCVGLPRVMMDRLVSEDMIPRKSEDAPHSSHLDHEAEVLFGFHTDSVHSWYIIS